MFTSVTVGEAEDRKPVSGIPIIPQVAEVMKDGDIVEPEWLNFPGREEVEKVLPKKYGKNHKTLE
jgi:hypothetical protein